MQTQPQHQPSPLPPNWSCHRTPQGQPYFHNHVTGETTWTPPQPKSSAVSQPTANPPASPTSTLESAVTSEPTPASAVATIPATLPASSTINAAAPAPAPFPSVPPSFSNQNGAPQQMALATSTVAHQAALPYTMEALVAKSCVKGGSGTALMEQERDKLLRLNIGTVGPDSYAWVRHGCVIARRGNIRIRRQGMREQGLGRLVKKAVTGEGVNLIKCEGRGVVFCADQALSASLRYEIKLMKGANIAAGGLFSISVSGTGLLAFTCHAGVVTLRATPQDPVYTDPNATVAWTHQPTLKLDMSMKSLVGRGTGEELQLQFNDGYVVVQPFEEVTMGAGSGGAVSSVGSFL